MKINLIVLACVLALALATHVPTSECEYVSFSKQGQINTSNPGGPRQINTNNPGGPRRARLRSRARKRPPARRRARTRGRTNANSVGGS